MSDRVPGHYRAYRIVLVGLVLGLVGLTVWYVGQPGHLEEILRLFRFEP